MDIRIKRRLAERVRRELTTGLASLGFRRTKTTYWVRDGEYAAEFIHLHLYTFGPSFRVHLGIRVLNDPFDAEVLNGPSSDVGFRGQGEKYVFEFEETAESVAKCAAALVNYCTVVAMPWFAQLRDPEALLKSEASPLDVEERERLRLALAGKSDDRVVRLSRSLLGLA